MARTKAHDPLRRFGWSAAGRAANTAFEMAALVSVIKSTPELLAAKRAMLKLLY